ncbi:MAG: hypothetical protein ACYC1C_03850 [Chloroflexota bacterium]
MLTELSLDDLQRLPLDDMPSLIQVMKHHWSALSSRQDGTGGSVTAGRMNCPTCGGVRPMRISLRYTRMDVADVQAEPEGGLAWQLVPSLLEYTCVQCDSPYTAVVYQGTDGPALAVLPAPHGSLATPHTSESVSFYLDQARKAQTAGAKSAAIAMYRGALECLLFEQGYMTGSLALKVHQLTSGVEPGSAPRWARELDSEFFSIIQELGNGTIHPNDGDIKRQATADGELLTLLDETFRMLLFLVYEVPHERNERLAALRQKAQMLKRG